MDLNKERREHNTKRVAMAFRGEKWSPESKNVKVVPRAADTVEQKKADN